MKSIVREWVSELSLFSQLSLLKAIRLPSIKDRYSGLNTLNDLHGSYLYDVRTGAIVNGAPIIDEEHATAVMVSQRDAGFHLFLTGLPSYDHDEVMIFYQAVEVLVSKHPDKLMRRHWRWLVKHTLTALEYSSPELRDEYVDLCDDLKELLEETSTHNS